LIKNILVAVDGSDCSYHALDFALDLARKYSAKILVLTVVPPVFLPISSLNVMKSKAVEEVTIELENSFKAILSKANEKAKKQVNVLTRLGHGSPDEVIIKTAKSEKIDMIIVGSRGLVRKDSALGSVSSRVVDNAACPVLVVK
jgi:nucleotide-binding universal stress UspA family protein